MTTFTQKIFCAFCRLERKVYSKKSIDWTNVALSFLSSTLVMYGIWQGWDGRIAIIFVIFLIFSEVFVRMRWRMSLPCPHCHFDPLVYKRDKFEAMSRVKTHLEGLRASGKYLLKQNNPFQHLPIVKYNPETKEKTIS